MIELTEADKLYAAMRNIQHECRSNGNAENRINAITNISNDCMRNIASVEVKHVQNVVGWPLNKYSIVIGSIIMRVPKWAKYVAEDVTSDVIRGQNKHEWFALDCKPDETASGRYIFPMKGRVPQLIGISCSEDEDIFQLDWSHAN